MKITFAVTIAALAACRSAVAEVNPALPQIPESVFYVTNYGAVGDENLIGILSS